jgi:hypothetical protein
MKTYQVEFKRTSFVNISIEAESEDDAEQKAWDECNRDECNRDEGYFKGDDADWTIETITEETSK